jgi:proprotein convertase subtilisin/kexin type 5
MLFLICIQAALGSELPCSLSHCFECEDSLTCIECQSGYSLVSPVLCEAIQPDESGCSLRSSEKICIKCGAGYKLENQACSPICGKDCSCEKASECIKERQRDLSGCYVQDCDTCGSSPYECSACSNGYGLTPKLECGTCSDNCNTCTYQNTCNNCKSGYSVYRDYCISLYNSGPLSGTGMILIITIPVFGTITIGM